MKRTRRVKIITTPYPRRLRSLRSRAVTGWQRQPLAQMAAQAAEFLEASEPTFKLRLATALIQPSYALSNKLRLRPDSGRAQQGVSQETEVL